MKRVIGLVIIAVLLAPPASAGVRHEKCRYQGVEKGKWTYNEVRWTIRCGADHFGTDVSTALAVADRESSFHWWATNATSQACGIYQHLPRYWPDRIATLRQKRPGLGPFRDSCYNARSNILVAMRMAAQSWSPWGLWKE